MKRKTIIIGGRKYIYIPGDAVSSKSVIRQLRSQHISQYRFELEKIRTDDSLSDFEKEVKSSSIIWKLRELEGEGYQRE